jgi:murein DD-endopeptidase MepM/ murein hydrolase activator NlpD
MIRSGATEGIKTAAKSQQELQHKATLRAFASSEELRQAVRENLQSELAQRGTTPTPEELDKLTDQAIASATRTGSADEATNALATQATALFYSFAPRGAKHDDTVRYRLPFDPSVPRLLGQGVGGDMGYDIYGNPVSSPQGDPASHLGRWKYGFDWSVPIGTPIVAARDGEVARVIDGGPAPAPASRANAVFLKHADGTWSEYVGLDAGIPVQPGQKVRAGDVIAKSGATGSWRGDRGNGQGLHFAVGHLDDQGEPETVPIRFDDGSAAGFVPVPGNFYGVSGGKVTKTAAPQGATQPPSN